MDSSCDLSSAPCSLPQGLTRLDQGNELWCPLVSGWVWPVGTLVGGQRVGGQRGWHVILSLCLQSCLRLAVLPTNMVWDWLSPHSFQAPVTPVPKREWIANSSAAVLGPYCPCCSPRPTHIVTAAPFRNKRPPCTLIGMSPVSHCASEMSKM